MKIKALHPKFQVPTRASEFAGGFDLYMPEDGYIESYADKGVLVGLGFAASVPRGHVALLLPRSGVGAKHGLELNNTCGVIDSDYTGEWKACLRVKDIANFRWKAGERLLQMVIVPVHTPTEFFLVADLDETGRSAGGFGSTGA